MAPAGAIDQTLQPFESAAVQVTAKGSTSGSLSGLNARRYQLPSGAPNLTVPGQFLVVPNAIPTRFTPTFEHLTMMCAVSSPVPRAGVGKPPKLSCSLKSTKMPRSDAA